MRLFLGDQSVVITKDFICFFEEADGCVRIVLGPSVDSVFRVRVRTLCLRCGLGELVGLACVQTKESESCRCCGTE